MSDAGRTNALEGVNPPGEARTDEVLYKRRILYGITTAGLAAMVALSFLGGLTDLRTFGVESARATAAGEGYELEVTYGAVTRPGLATPFAVEVRRTGGFDQPLTIAIDHGYMELWDENGFYPTASAETTMGDWLLYEFDAPEGETFRFTYDGRLGPAVQSGRTGRVAVMDANVPVVEVDFHTRVLP